MIEQLAEMPNYGAYKDSGVEWLGEIPAHWSIKKITHSYKVIGSGTTPLSSDQRYYGGEINWLQTGDLTDGVIVSTNKKITTFALNSYSSLKLYPCTSLVIAMYGATIGKVGILGIETATNQACCVLGQTLHYQMKFSFYKFLAFKENIISMSYGGGQPNISQELVRSLRLPCPPLTEQSNIAAFLDRKTTQIDQAVAIKEQQIALLKEHKQILIQNAVTRGLDPNAPMRDSGVKWIGEIPAHWEIVTLKRIVDFIQTGPFGAELHAHDYIENGIPLVNPKHMKEGGIIPDFNCSVDESTLQRLQKYQLVNGDLIMARRGELGRCAIVSAKEDGWLCGTGSLVVRIKQGYFNIKYFFRIISGSGVAEILSLDSVGSTMDNLNTTIVGKLVLPIPNIVEQTAIVTHIETQSAKIELAIAIQQQQIDKLKEYKTTLINSAVTGKIHVPEVVI